MATVREQSHVGSLNDYPLMAAKAGLIGILMCDSGQSPKSVAPFGGREARLGTNPICIAFPIGPAGAGLHRHGDQRGRGRQAERGAGARPADPARLAPRQGRQADHRSERGPEWRRHAAAGRPGGPQGVRPRPSRSRRSRRCCPGLGFGIDPQGRHNDGSFMLAIDPSAFMPLDEFKGQVEGFVKYLKETPPAEGFKEVLYPGEKEYYTAAAAPRRKASRSRTAPGSGSSQLAERFGQTSLLKTRS